LKLLVMPTLAWALNPVMPAVSGITWCKKNQQLIFSLPVICWVPQKKK
jgi:hypothetical protein